jgi:hypothetical protein
MVEESPITMAADSTELQKSSILECHGETEVSNPADFTSTESSEEMHVLCSDMNVHPQAILELRVVDKYQVALSMELETQQIKK